MRIKTFPKRWKRGKVGREYRKKYTEKRDETGKDAEEGKRVRQEQIYRLAGQRYFSRAPQ